jgi:F0F1-type ATP synthase membrane subunit b/b'
MPQFDFFSFFVQIFWLTIGSFIFYLVYLKLVIKNSSEAIKMRQKLILFIKKVEENKSASFIYDTVMKLFRTK